MFLSSDKPLSAPAVPDTIRFSDRPRSPSNRVHLLVLPLHTHMSASRQRVLFGSSIAQFIVSGPAHLFSERKLTWRGRFTAAPDELSRARQKM